MNDAHSVNLRSDLRPAFAGRSAGSLLEIDAWIPSEISKISPLVERLMRLIEGSHCTTGEESAVELALREALSNAGRSWQPAGCSQISSRPLPLQGREGNLGHRFRPRSRVRSPHRSRFRDCRKPRSGSRTRHSSHEVGDGRGLVRTARRRGSHV